MCFFRLIFARLAPAILVVLLFSSCASVGVREVSRLDPNPPRRVPGKVFVAPFSFTEQGIRVDRTGADLANFKVNLSEFMMKNLLLRLPKHVAPAEAVAANGRVPRGNYWLIRGNFDRVYQGSRLLRSVIGLGVGATVMETTIVVYDLSGRTPMPFLRIVTTGGSNVSPGIVGIATVDISGPMALTNVFNALDGVRSGITFDTVRTTREVNAALSEFLYQRGAIPKSKALAPKRTGSILNQLGPPDQPRMKGSIHVEAAN